MIYYIAMNDLFTGDTYKTQHDLPRGLVNSLFLNTRLGFFLPFFRIALRYRSICLKNRDSAQLWVDHSFWIFKTIERSGGRIHLQGLDNLRNVDGPVVVVCNHMGSMETMILPALLNPYFPITFVVKRSLQTSWLFGPIMRSRKTIGVDRVNPREDFQTVMTEGSKKLGQGISVVIFPQATRELAFIPEKFNSMGIKLARKAKVKILPVALKTDFWGNGKWIKDFGPIEPSKPIHFAFGKALTIEGNGSKQHEQCIDFIRSQTDQWNR